MIRDIDLELNVAALGGTTHSLRKRTDHRQRLDLAGNGHGRDATHTGPAKLDIPRQRPAGMKSSSSAVVVVMSRAVSAAADSMTARV